MANLGFLKAYRDLVNEGQKTTTLRRWKRPMVRAGQIVNSPGIGRLEIASVERVEWADLTEADARSDGFRTLADLDRAVRRIYPHMEDDGRSWFKVCFRALDGIVHSKQKRAKSQRPKPSRVTTGRSARAAGRRVSARGTMSLKDKSKLATAVRQQPMFGVG